MELHNIRCFTGQSGIVDMDIARDPSDLELALVDSAYRLAEQKTSRLWEKEFPKTRTYAFAGLNKCNAAYIIIGDMYIVDSKKTNLDLMPVHESAHRLKELADLAKSGLSPLAYEKVFQGMAKGLEPKSFMTALCRYFNSEIFAYYTQKALGYSIDGIDPLNKNFYAVIPRSFSDFNIVYNRLKKLALMGYDTHGVITRDLSKFIANELHEQDVPKGQIKEILLGNQESFDTFSQYVEICRLL